jgi:hypothetical protein
MRNELHFLETFFLENKKQNNASRTTLFLKLTRTRITMSARESIYLYNEVPRDFILIHAHLVVHGKLSYKLLLTFISLPSCFLGEISKSACLNQKMSFLFLLFILAYISFLF